CYTGSMKHYFRKFSERTSHAVGTYWAFIIAFCVIVSWFVTGPFFGFSDTWQLIINTATTIVTFLMVFIIQNTQNRDSKAIHLKLDELIYATKKASNRFMNVEELSDEEIEKDKRMLLRISRARKEKKDFVVKKTRSPLEMLKHNKT